MSAAVRQTASSTRPSMTGGSVARTAVSVGRAGAPPAGRWAGAP
jgi:hypothetical protein